MNYEDKYKRSLSRATFYNGELLTDNQRKMLVDIFPELKVSEDEKMKKAIMHILYENYTDAAVIEGVEIAEIVTWLEEQSEKKSADEVLKIRQKLYQSGYNDGYKHGQEDMASKESDNELTRKSLINFLKSPFVHENITDEKVAPWIAWLEKQGNQPTDKVEPKFHAGDWISGYYTNYKVLSVNNAGYAVEDTDGDKINILFENEKFHHLFTIADAKDGDVLYSIDSKQPFIYKERPQFSQARGYCCINKFGEFAIWNTSKCVICTEKYIPATKEQRDLLFQKMKEAGYKWDAERKELKEIEHTALNADDVIEWLKTKVYDDSTYGRAMIEQFKNYFGL